MLVGKRRLHIFDFAEIKRDRAIEIILTRAEATLFHEFEHREEESNSLVLRAPLEHDAQRKLRSFGTRELINEVILVERDRRVVVLNRVPFEPREIDGCTDAFIRLHEIKQVQLIEFPIFKNVFDEVVF